MPYNPDHDSPGQLSERARAAVNQAREESQVVPVDNDIARLSVQLPDYPHSDPADRMIIATAQSPGAPVVTRDLNIRSHPRVSSVWQPVDAYFSITPGR